MTGLKDERMQKLKALRIDIAERSSFVLQLLTAADVLEQEAFSLEQALQSVDDSVTDQAINADDPMYRILNRFQN